jgi:hypothetical protein
MERTRRSPGCTFGSWSEHVLETIFAVVVAWTRKIDDMGKVFSTLTVSDAVEVLFAESVASTQRVDVPFPPVVVFQETEYSVPLAVEVDPMRVLEARVAP